MDFTIKALGGTWVVPRIDAPSANPVSMSVAIAVKPDDNPTGADITVVVSAGGATLAQLTGPDATSPLPVIELKGMTAQALYGFDNPQNASVDTVTITYKNETETFDNAFLNS